MRNIGKIKETVLGRSVIKPIEQNKVGITGASIGLDCAFFGENGIATGYVSYNDSKACSHAISQACNNLYAKGVKPEYISLSISMPDSYREIKLKEIMKQACDKAAELNVKIVGGHTEYVQGLMSPIINVTAIGKVCYSFEPPSVKEHLDIVMTKWMSLAGTSIIAREKRNQLVEKLPAYYVDEAASLDQFIDISKEAQIAIETKGTILMHDVGGGGVFTALWEICKELGCGCDVGLNDIPLLQETIEVSEFFDINPYRLRGDGALLIITSNGAELVEKLKAKEINACIIGKTNESIDKTIIRDDETRFLEPGNGDELYSVLG